MDGDDSAEGGEVRVVGWRVGRRVGARERLVGARDGATVGAREGVRLRLGLGVPVGRWV